jgi:hypothetical protein
VDKPHFDLGKVELSCNQLRHSLVCRVD